MGRNEDIQSAYKYLTRYQKHFKDPVIHRFDMEHEELLVLHPEQWAEKVKELCL